MATESDLDRIRDVLKLLHEQGVLAGETHHLLTLLGEKLINIRFRTFQERFQYLNKEYRHVLDALTGPHGVAFYKALVLRHEAKNG